LFVVVIGYGNDYKMLQEYFVELGKALFLLKVIGDMHEVRREK